MGIRKIDYERCTGCAKCVDGCPMDVLRLDRFVFNKEERPPCQVACPASANIRDYIYLLTQRRIAEAAEMLRDALVIPSVTGRVCFHPCESACARKEVDESVNINSLERHVADYLLEAKAQPVPRIQREKVAIIGSGPAGLAAAYGLAKRGYPVTVFESLPVLGGMLRVGIPDYRLPRDVLEAQINYITDLGAEMKTSTPVGDKLTLDSLFDQGYKAAFIAIGAHKNQQLSIPGENIEGVVNGLTFLRELNTGKRTRAEGRVVVIGGGNVAVHAARTALRLGGQEVFVFYPWSRAEMSAFAEEVEEALAEGVKIDFLVAPLQMVRKNGHIEVQCVRMKRGAKDAAGRRTLEPTSGSEFGLEADMVIAAVGEIPDVPAQFGLKQSGGRILVDPRTLATDKEGIFAGGDAVSGPSSVIKAIATGKRAVTSIERYLKGGDLRADKEPKPKRVRKPPKEGVEEKPRQEAPRLPVALRRGNLREFKTGYSREMALEEAQRCMACGSKAFIKYLRDCMTCYLCEVDCPEEAICVSPERERRIPLPW